MLASILPVPFADADRQRQYEAVLAALEAEADAPATVLLGNLGAFTPVQADMVVVRPAGLALVVLVPQAGQLTMQALTHGPWQLGEQPLPNFAESNPYVQFQQQLPSVLTWVGEQLSLGETALLSCAGLVLFEAPLTFGLGVETQLHHYTATPEFQLVGGASHIPTRLRHLFAGKESLFTEDELVDWANYLVSEPADSGESASQPSIGNFIEQKLRQLWSWLGAEDIPPDPPYGEAAPVLDQHLRDQQEPARLHQLRQELLAELAQQRQEAAAREASRTQELAQLRQQLAQAGQPAAERQAEQQAQAALEESLRTARTELAIRNQELDNRLRQLEQLIEQVRKPVPAAPAVPVVPPAKLADVPASAPRLAAPRPATPKVVYRRMRQAERWGLVTLALGIMAAGGWGMVRWLHPAKSRPLTTTQARPAHGGAQPAEDQTPAPVIIYDSVAHVSLIMADTTLKRGAAATSADHEAAQQIEAAPERTDSATAGAEPPRPATTDSAVTSPAP